MASVTLEQRIKWARAAHYPWINEDYPQLGPSCVDDGEDYPCTVIQLCDETEALNKQVAAMHAGHAISDNDSCNVVIKILQMNNVYSKGLIKKVRELCWGRGNETAIAVAMTIDAAEG